ncbi:unnamed protein product, partial [Rotaria sordida]
SQLPLLNALSTHPIVPS